MAETTQKATHQSVRAAYLALMYDERKVEIRSRVLRHMDTYVRPPARFYEEIEAAVDLAAADQMEELTEVDGWRVPVKRIVEFYGLNGLIEWLRDDGLLDEAEWTRRREEEEAERQRFAAEYGIDLF